MSAVIDCTCGAKISLPDQPASRALRCPQCQTGIALSANGDALVTRPWRLSEGRASCPICQSSLAEGEPVVGCPQCDQVHHLECWSEIGGCGTYGCKQAPTLEKGPATAQPLSAWGDSKKCPVCGETIKAIAIKCRYCQTSFGTANPLTLGDMHRRDRRKQSQKGLATLVTVLFALSVIGCLAPVMLFVDISMLLPKREEIRKAGPIYLVLAYSAVVLSVIYSMLMVLFFILGLGS